MCLDANGKKNDDHGFKRYRMRIAQDRCLRDQSPALLTPPAPVSRRSALALLGGGASLLLAACGGSDSASTSTSSTTSTSTTSSTPSSACTDTPEGEIGPYFADDSASGFNRSDILSNLDGTDTQSGVPFTLTLTVTDTDDGCALMEGVQVDIWHCNPSGVYSDIASENTSTQTWLRGYQLTDSSGQVTFKTILPGWYSGRTTHIHLRFRSTYSEASSTSDGSNTTQVFFAQTLLDTLATSVSPYDNEGTNPTTNAADRVYADQTHGTMQMTLAGSVSAGYTASMTIGLPITAETS